MIFRIQKNKENPYVMVNKHCIMDSNLSAKATGILIYLLSRPDNWQIYEIEICKHFTDGRASIRSGVKELITAGYIHRTQTRGENGKFKNYIYSVHEQPVEKDPLVNSLLILCDSPMSENRTSVGSADTIGEKKKTFLKGVDIIGKKNKKKRKALSGKKAGKGIGIIGKKSEVFDNDAMSAYPFIDKFKTM